MKKLKVGKKSGLRYFDIDDVRSWKPCYEPERHLKPGVRYTAIKILQNEAIPFHDRLWVVLRTDLVSEKLMRLFAVWSARQVQHLMPDPRSIKALEIAESFANGNATQEQLETAYAAAYTAADDAAYAAAYAAYAAYAAAAYAAAYTAAYAAAYVAADAAAYAARAAADDAAYTAQRDKLIEMIIAEGKESRV